MLVDCRGRLCDTNLLTPQSIDGQLGMQDKLRRSWQERERKRINTLEQVWRQRQHAQDAAHQADMAKQREALAADCRQAREVRALGTCLHRRTCCSTGAGC